MKEKQELCSFHDIIGRAAAIFFFVVVSFLYALFALPAGAQEIYVPYPNEPENMSRAVVCRDDPTIKFGHYAYLHCLLHKEGTIPALMKAAGSECCDGGTGGECRATIIIQKDGKWWAELDGQLCPLGEIKVHFDIPFPDKVMAVVCASKNTYDTGPVGSKGFLCPAAHCAAASLGG